MNPRKAKETGMETAKDLELDPFIVEDVLSFYWKEVRKTLTKAEQTSVQIINLGSFRVKGPKALKIYLENYKRVAAAKNPSEFQITIGQKMLENKIRIVANLIEVVEKERGDRLTFKIKKNGQSYKGLEEQK